MKYHIIQAARVPLVKYTEGVEEGDLRFGIPEVIITEDDVTLAVQGIKISDDGETATADIVMFQPVVPVGDAENPDFISTVEAVERMKEAKAAFAAEQAEQKKLAKSQRRRTRAGAPKLELVADNTKENE